MDYNRSSDVSVRQFEATAIKKLMAEGVPYDVAHAFVTIGIVRRSQDYARIRDAVCPMEYHEFFIPRSQRDHTDPLRLGGPGALVPRTAEVKLQRFYTEFAMSDIESVRFVRAFPEFNVITSGKTFNQHAYYANKRFAETELLVSMVFRHAHTSGRQFDPTSLVDLGGNMSWHIKRDRAYVHCDNPVLSVRDRARYTVREVFSGEDPAARCHQTFQECKVTAQYAIGVHSTYDTTPKKIAGAMLARGIHTFFGVMNIIPGLQAKPAGVYEEDGLVATVVRPSRELPYVKYTFRHDPALEYAHRLVDGAQYLYVSRQYDFLDQSGYAARFLYKIESVRGSAMVFSITRHDETSANTNTIWTPPRTKTYTLTIRALDIGPMEVSCEFLDRLVMEAAGARNFSDYDIVSLYRYAKSLRQRVSINGIVLSSGYCMTPHELVGVVIGAYEIAAAFRVESVEYFKRATSQIVRKRSGGFLRDVFSISAGALSAVVDNLGAVVGKYTFYTALNDKLKSMIRDKFPVDVMIDKPQAGRGLGVMEEMLRPQPMKLKGTQLVRADASGQVFTPLSPGGWDAKLVPTRVVCAGEKCAFYSYGVPSLGLSELARDCKPVYYGDLDIATDYPVRSEEYRRMAYGKAIRDILQLVGWDDAPLVTSCGDRIFRMPSTSRLDGRVLGRDDMPFVGLTEQYVVCRGVGSRVVALGKPKIYFRGVCLGFLLFYEKTGDEVKKDRGKILPVVTENRAESLPSYQTVPGEGDDMTHSEWSVLLGQPGVKKYTSQAEAARAVARDVAEGIPTATGALDPEEVTPPQSMASTPVLGAAVTRRVATARSEPGAPSVAQSEWGDLPAGAFSVAASVSNNQKDKASLAPTKSSDEEAAGSSEKGQYARLSMEEFVRACAESEKVAIESTKSCMDLARAVSRGETNLTKWNSTVQGVPGDPFIVRVYGDKWTAYSNGEDVEHMAVSDGNRVYDRLVNKPPDGYYVSSAVMEVYTGAAIKNSVASVVEDGYECEVVSMNGVAGSGKTYHIVQNAEPVDVVLCETSAALKHTAKELNNKPGWSGRASTVDSFLVNRPVWECQTLWVDESFRLHAAKIYALMKILRPARILCFGDSKQIPVLPYIPAFDFAYHEFMFTRTELKRDSWRCPADVCFALSTPTYYGFQMTTHNSIRRSIQGVLPYNSEMFYTKARDVMLLVYSQSVKEDLKKAGVENVMTIGESQGSTFENVMLFRDSPLGKVLYFNEEQTLVALTRHSKSFVYVTAALGVDRSAAHNLIRYVEDNQSELKLASHAVLDDGAVGATQAEVDVTVVSEVESDSDELFSEYENLYIQP